MQEHDGMVGSLVLTAAENLARAIRMSSEWRELEAARAAFQTDQELVALLDRYRSLSARWRDARTQGRALGGAEAMELVEVEDKIRQHPLAQRQQDALAAFVLLLQQTNQVISQSLGFDFAANAVSRSGGCCG